MCVRKRTEGSNPSLSAIKQGPNGPLFYGGMVRVQRTLSGNPCVLESLIPNLSEP